MLWQSDKKSRHSGRIFSELNHDYFMYFMSKIYKTCSMWIFVHSVANNIQNATVSTGCRQKVLGHCGFIFYPIAIKFYIVTQGIISFYMTPRMPYLDERLKSWFFEPKALRGVVWNLKDPKVLKPDQMFGLWVGDFVPQYQKNYLQKKKHSDTPLNTILPITL